MKFHVVFSIPRSRATFVEFSLIRAAAQCMAWQSCTPINGLNRVSSDQTHWIIAYKVAECIGGVAKWRLRKKVLKGLCQVFQRWCLRVQSFKI